jgi:hypothetical protein
MRIPYGRVQGSGYNACTGKYCIICPGGTKKRKKRNKGGIKIYGKYVSIPVWSVDRDNFILKYIKPSK